MQSNAGNIEKRIHTLELDVKNQEQITETANHIRNQITPEIDFLINNAAVMLKAYTPNEPEKVKETLNVNFFAPYHLINNFVYQHGLMDASSDHDKETKAIINLGARICQISKNKYLQAIQEFQQDLTQQVFQPKALSQVQMDEKQLVQVMKSILMNSEYMSEDILKKIPKMFPDAPYMVSKVGLHALTRITAKTLQQQQAANATSSNSNRQHILSLAVCPSGYGVKNTGLGHPKAPVTPEQGIQTILDIIQQPDQYQAHNGSLLGDFKVIPYA